MASESDRTTQLLRNITGALIDLFGTDETFFITNGSMQVLLAGLAQHLDEAVEDTSEDALFERWHRTMPTTKKYLLEIARTNPLYLLDGRLMPIMSESKARQLLSACLPDSPKF